MGILDHKTIVTHSLDELNSAEKQKLLTNIIDKIHATCLVFAKALTKYGEHEEDCVDDDECTCGLSEIQNAAMNLLELEEYINGKTTVN